MKPDEIILPEDPADANISSILDI